MGLSFLTLIFQCWYAHTAGLMLKWAFPPNLFTFTWIWGCYWVGQWLKNNKMGMEVWYPHFSRCLRRAWSCAGISNYKWASRSGVARQWVKEWELTVQVYIYPGIWPWKGCIQKVFWFPNHPRKATSMHATIQGESSVSRNWAYKKTNSFTRERLSMQKNLKSP